MPRVTVTAPDKMPQPYRFQLDRRVVMIGRGSENDIAVDCGSISVRHAEMVRVEGGYELRDLGSTNGIKLDGKRCEVIPLRHGASVKLGDVAFDFQLSEEEREALRRERVLDDAPVVAKTETVLPAKEAGADEAPAAEPKKRPAVATSEGGGGFMIFLLILAFALVAFFAGLAIHHYRDTGGWLFDAIQSKGKTLKANRDAQAPPTPAADAPAAPPEVPAPAPPAQPAPTTPAPGP